MYRQNPFVFTFSKNGINALYNSLTLSTVYMKDSKYEQIKENPTKELIDNDFFVNVEFDSFGYLKKFKELNYQKSQIHIAYFLVTSRCNFNCKYCFVKSRFKNEENSFMDKETAKKAVSLLTRNTDKVKIIFYGGEPLLNFDIIKFVVEETKRQGLKAQYSIISNGGIINDEIIELWKNNNFSISISLDGLEENNDKVRVKNNDSGTFVEIIRTIERLKENDIKFGISCTVSTGNISVPDEILEILNKYKIKRLGYNLLSENENISLSKDENILMVKNILIAEDVILENGIMEDKIIRRKLIPFIEKKNWTRDCAGYGKQVIITPKGEVGTCHGLWPDFVNKETKTYFDIDVDYLGDISKHPTWMEWNERLPMNMPQCWNCFGLGICGGGCAKNSLLRKGSIWEVDEDICNLTKEAVPWVVWKYYDIKIKNQNSY